MSDSATPIKLYQSIPLHGIGMLYEKSMMGERLEDGELEQLFLHFMILEDLLRKSGPYFRFAANAAAEEFRKLNDYRSNRIKCGAYNPGPCSQPSPPDAQLVSPIWW